MKRLLKLPAVIEATGLGRSSVYRLVAEGHFPKPLKLSARSVAWREDEIQKWIESRPVSGGEADA